MRVTGYSATPRCRSKTVTTCTFACPSTGTCQSTQMLEVEKEYEREGADAEGNPLLRDEQSYGHNVWRYLQAYTHVLQRGGGFKSENARLESIQYPYPADCQTAGEVLRPRRQPCPQLSGAGVPVPTAGYYGSVLPLCAWASATVTTCASPLGWLWA